MARPKNTEAPDLTQPVNMTAGVIERLTCPPDKAQAFMRDTQVPGLRVRVTTAGAKSFVFEAKLNRQTIRRTIGDVKAWSIEQARTEARRLAVSLDNGHDPREVERQQRAAQVAQQAAQAAQEQARTLGAMPVWNTYMEARRPHWGERHYRDHLTLSRAGGKQTNIGTGGRGVTIDAPLHALLVRPLSSLTAPVIDAWAAEQAKNRPTAARLALRMPKAFMGWCADQPEYAHLLPDTNPAKSKKAREALGKAQAKTDALLKEQLPAWFAHVRAIGNQPASAYLQIILLTGARPGEVLAMRWDDLNTQWRGLTIRDKVEGERIIPLTPYVHHLIATLPRRNGWVFASASQTDGHMSAPHRLHERACAAAGIDGLTLHGLRRSFKSLTEWLECPAGVVAQLMGHKPSATAEKHYTVRPLDLLRIHHERIEAFILEQAGVTFDRAAVPGRLALVAA